MNKNKLATGILLLLAGLVLESVLPGILFRLFTSLSLGGTFVFFAIRLITLAVVTIVFVKGGGHILKSANKGKIRSENARAIMVIGLLIFVIPQILQLLTVISYELAQLISNFLFFVTGYFIPHILALGMIVLAFFILSKKQTKEEIEEEDHIASQPVPYSKFTYIGSAIVSLPFLIAAILLFEQLYSYPEDFLIPKSFISSDLFWVITIIMLLSILFTQGLEFYKVEYRDSSGNKVGMDRVDGNNAFQDQIGGLAMTFLMPIFVAAIMALIPYYILYFTINFFLMNAFTIALLVLLLLLVFGALFIYSRKDKNKTGEILWLISWFFIGLFILFILYMFL